MLKGTVAGGAVLTAASLFGGISAHAAPVKQLVVALPNTPPRADPAFVDQFVEHELVDNICDRLFEYKASKRADGMLVIDGKGVAPIEPMLAESWEVSDDRRTYTIHLRKGVKSNFGNELTTEDVRWTVQRNLALKANGPYYLGAINFATDEAGMSNFKVVDKYTFQMTTQNPNALFFKVMALPFLAILDSVEGQKHATSDDAWAATWFKTHSAAFGPYAIAEWSPGEAVILEANKYYWKGPAPLPRVIMREVPDSANRVALLRNGDVDVAEYLNARERASLKGVDGVTIFSVEPGHQSSWLAMNNETKPFDDPKVRQAICYAVPYGELVNTVTQGTGRRQMSPLPAPYEFYNAGLSPYDTNLDKAKQLLAEAGLKDGFKTTLGFSNAAPEDEETAKIIKAGLAKVGVDVTLDKQPFAAFVERWLGLGQERFPMSTMYAGAAVPDAAYALRLWWYSKNNILDFTKYHNPEVDDLLDKLIQTFDDKEREELTNKLQGLILNDASMAFLVEPGIHYPVRANISGVSYFTDSGLRYFNLNKT